MQELTSKLKHPELSEKIIGVFYEFITNAHY